MELPAPVGTDAPDASGAVTLFVCTTCRMPGVPDGPPAGEALAQAARAATGAAGVQVKPVRCLANCKRGLTAAIVRDGGWTYVFGDLAPDSAPDLLAGAALFAGSSDGLMPWRCRPDSLKRGMIARVPPLSFCEDQK